MTVILRTHGGLGNQIFQILYARLCAAQCDVAYVEIHDMNYAHKFERSSEIAMPTQQASSFQRSISALRIPKLLVRGGFRTTERATILGDQYLDGYFQDEGDYRDFPPVSIKLQIDRLRGELGIGPRRAGERRSLHHVRLGDFFADRKEALSHAISRIGELPHGCDLITNDEAIFAESAVAEVLKEKSCILRTTDGYRPEEVIRLMARYEHIVTNNSTLALWASIFGDCETQFSDERLSKVHAMLKKAAYG